MKKILVTAIGGDVGYGVVKSIKMREKRLYIAGCDTMEYNYSRDEVDEFFIAPPYRDEKSWIEIITGFMRENNIDYFWPVTEPEIKIVDKNRESFKGVTVFINASNVLEISLDKGKTADTLKNAGIDTPKTWYGIDEFKNTKNVEFPIILKEKFSCGSHGVCVVEDMAELEEKLKEMEDAIIQEYVGSSDDEYTMTVFADGCTVNHIAFKRTLGLGGMSRYVELVKDEKLEDTAKMIAGLFNLKGSINVQMRRKNNHYYVFEINPRISSTIGFRNQLGFNDVAWWIDMQEGISVEKYIAPNKKVHGVRCVEEKLFFE
jgi:carbamoyl-phosphate synthase large subunit